MILRKAKDVDKGLYIIIRDDTFIVSEIIEGPVDSIHPLLVGQRIIFYGNNELDKAFSIRVFDNDLIEIVK